VNAVVPILHHFRLRSQSLVGRKWRAKLKKNGTIRVDNKLRVSRQWSNNIFEKNLRAFFWPFLIQNKTNFVSTGE